MGDVDRVLKWMDEAVVYQLTGTHPFSRRTQGAQAMRDLIAEVQDHFADSSLRYHIERLIDCGSTVVSTYRGTGCLANGNAYNNEYSVIWDFKGDKVFHITDFFDSYHVSQAMLGGR